MSIKCIARLRSRRVVQDQLEEGSDEATIGGAGGGGCCWANLPHELLREVLLRIEESETCWPQRKTVVACAGVCRSWRFIIKQIVKVPQLSGKLTFPISVKQPGPRDRLLQCFIKRNRSTQTYYLYLGLTNDASVGYEYVSDTDIFSFSKFSVYLEGNIPISYVRTCVGHGYIKKTLTDDGKFLLAACKSRRPTCTGYIISLRSDDLSKGSGSYVGKLRSNFLGTKFSVFDGQPPHPGATMTKSRSSRLANSKQVSPRVHLGNYPMARISYELNMLGSRGPRRMQCIMDTIPATSIRTGVAAPNQAEFSFSDVDVLPSIPIFHSKLATMESFLSGPLSGEKDGGALVLRNKSPRWHEQLQCWCLNFHGRVTVASVKNFQLVASPENGPAGPEHEKIILQFGKVGKDLFTMDYRYPISAFQAFAICLSSFDTKIACE